MSILNQIKEVDRRLREVAREEKAHFKKRWAVEQSRSALLLRYALTEGLQEAEWTATISHINDLGYSVDLSAGCEDFPKLMGLLKCGYHASVEVSPGTTLYINDGRLDLNCKDPSKALGFIKKHKIRINLKPIEEEKTRAENRARELGEFLVNIRK